MIGVRDARMRLTGDERVLCPRWVAYWASGLGNYADPEAGGFVRQ